MTIRIRGQVTGDLARNLARHREFRGLLRDEMVRGARRELIRTIKRRTHRRTGRLIRSWRVQPLPNSIGISIENRAPYASFERSSGPAALHKALRVTTLRPWMRKVGRRALNRWAGRLR